MKMVVFGLTISSSWGNGHATLWRGLARALGAFGVEVVFFERDQPYYASHRDSVGFTGVELVLYSAWSEIEAAARAQVREADVTMVTSFCADGPEAADLAREHARFSIFYDMDTPVTLASLGVEPVTYLPRGGMSGFDLVLSFTGGDALNELQRTLGARTVRTLFGGVDPLAYGPAAPSSLSAGDGEAALSHLGTFAADRRTGLQELFFDPAGRRPAQSFLLGGAQYPPDLAFPPNVRWRAHVPPHEHAAFYAAAPVTLNITRGAMAALGYCPSGRLFEAAACATPVISDVWPGIEEFFTPGEEILLARGTDDVLEHLALGRGQLRRIGLRARERALDEHTCLHRARQLLDYLDHRDDRQELA